MTTAIQPSNPYPIRFVRTPEAVEPYTINWVLNPGDTIATSTWTCDAALQIVGNPSMTSSTTTVTLGGGPLPANQPWWNYHAVNTITTNQGATDQRTVVLFTKQL
jgi:hypothetical protein